MSSKEVRFVLKTPDFLFKSLYITAWFLRSDEIKVGFNINKKMGSSVERNKFKRRVRNYLRPCGVFRNSFFCVVAPNIKLSKVVDFDVELSKLHSWVIKKI